MHSLRKQPLPFPRTIRDISWKELLRKPCKNACRKARAVFLCLYGKERHPLPLHGRQIVNEGIHHEQEGQCGSEERGLGDIHVEPVELGGRHGEDGRRRRRRKHHAPQQHGVVREAKRHRREAQRQVQEFHRKNRPELPRIGTDAGKIQVVAHGNHAHPGAGMDEEGKGRADGLRPRHGELAQGQPHQNAHRGKLVPGEKQIAEAGLVLHRLFPVGPEIMIPLGRGEAEQDDHEDLRNGDELGVGKADLAVQHIGAEPCQRADIAEHHDNEIAPLTPRIGEAVLVQQIKYRDG